MALKRSQGQWNNQLGVAGHNDVGFAAQSSQACARAVLAHSGLADRAPHEPGSIRHNDSMASNATASGFSSLGLTGPLLAAVTSLGYEEPTPIQREAIPVLLEGPRCAGSGRDRDRKNRGLCAPDAASAGQPAVERTWNPRPGDRADARACDAGRGSHTQVWTWHRDGGRSDLWRRLDVAAAPCSRARRDRRRRHAWTSARSPPPWDPRPVRSRADRSR